MSMATTSHCQPVLEELVKAGANLNLQNEVTVVIANIEPSADTLDLYVGMVWVRYHSSTANIS